MAVPEGDEKLRGRRRGRNGERPDDEEAVAAAAAAVAEAQGSGASSAEDEDADGPSRKRRRSRKALDKKFPCPWAECGKSYSRAEHLYRHQLNHSPKQIYKCDFPGCPREFVRQDLCQRHQERHTAKNHQQPQRATSLMQGLHGPAGAGAGVDVKSSPLLDPHPLARRIDIPAPGAHDAVVTPVKSEPPLSPYLGRDRTMTPIKNEASPGGAGTYQSPFGSNVAPKSAGLPRQRRPPDRTGSAPGVGLKRAESEAGHRVDDAGRIMDASVAPRSNPRVRAGAGPRRGASFGSLEAGRPQLGPAPDGMAVSPAGPRAPPPPVNTNNAFTAASSVYSTYAVASPARAHVDPSQVTMAGASYCGGGGGGGGSGGGGGGGGGGHGMYVNAQGFVPLSLPPPVYPNMSQASSSRGSDGNFVESPATSMSSVEQQQQQQQQQHQQQNQHHQNHNSHHQHRHHHQQQQQQQQQQAAAVAAAAAASHAGTMAPGVSDGVLVDPAAYAPSSFGGYGMMTRSPFSIPEAFAEWLFGDNQVNNSLTTGQNVGSAGIFNFGGPFGPSFQSGFVPDGFELGGGGGGGGGFDPQLMAAHQQQQQHPMAVTSILGPDPVELQLSEYKRQQLIELIETRFNEPDPASLSRQKDEVLAGDRDADTHVLSLAMIRTYIGSYWYHFHPQLPLLHRPTFVPDEAQNLLLIAMITIGASCLEKIHGHAVTQDSARLASFLALHLRWEIFLNAHFTPPAKLWVFQAALLLEIYEKLYSTRTFHERAHIHHATTITLMRRGSSLIGKSALDSPPSIKDEKMTSTGQAGGAGGGGGGGGGGGAIGSSQPSGTTTPDRWWNEWITAEATRRAAFAAFVIDATHATMFGHSAALVAHEIQLPLPYDESLWSATSGAEVSRLEANMRANGVERVRFLDGLKQTLNNKSVRTNAFGRSIIMAGLLSVSWHMNQRDLQLNSLGVAVTMGGRDRWRGALRAAFDFWKKDFEDSLAEFPEPASEPSAYPFIGAAKVQEDIVLESKNVLHHLAHMAMHVDIIDCQIFAKAPRLLGRTISPQDYKAGADRMRDWAPTAKARDAAFYALRFLSDVLCTARYAPTTFPPEPGSMSSSSSSDEQQQQQQHVQPHGQSQAHGQAQQQHQQQLVAYSAREDFLMNRPWVLFFAALIVWSYGFALEGPLPQPSSPTTKNPTHPNHAHNHNHNNNNRPMLPTTSADKYHDMRDFLSRVGAVESPEGLSSVVGRNRCVGLLMVVRDMFETTRWELLEEASRLLSNCVDLLVGTKQ